MDLDFGIVLVGKTPLSRLSQDYFTFGVVILDKHKLLSYDHINTVTLLVTAVNVTLWSKHSKRIKSDGLQHFSEHTSK